jgi:uncharacterized protein (DUF1778 family)
MAIHLSEREEQSYFAQTNELHLTVSDQRRLVESLDTKTKPNKSMMKGLRMYDEYLAIRHK